MELNKIFNDNYAELLHYAKNIIIKRKSIDVISQHDAVSESYLTLSGRRNVSMLMIKREISYIINKLLKECAVDCKRKNIFIGLFPCNKCKKEKDASEFRIRTRKNGSQYIETTCKECNYEIQKKWIAKNRDRHNRIWRNYYYRNKPIVIKKVKEWKQNKKQNH